MLSLHLLAVNKGGFGLSKNGFSFFIHWLCHFLWAVKVFHVIFWPFYLVKKSIKTLDARKKWHSHHMKKPNPFLEGSNLLLLTAKRYKSSINYRQQNLTIGMKYWCLHLKTLDVAIITTSSVVRYNAFSSPWMTVHDKIEIGKNCERKQ